MRSDRAVSIDAPKTTLSAPRPDLPRPDATDQAAFVPIA